MKYVRKGVRMLVVMFIGSPAVYVSSYLLTVEAYVEKAVADPHHHRVPRYVVGGDTAAQIYAPLHKLDTQIRAKYWQGL